MTPINLNKARKAKARADKRARADENSVKFGLSREKKQLIKAKNDLEVRKIDAHRTSDET